MKKNKKQYSYTTYHHIFNYFHSYNCIFKVLCLEGLLLCRCNVQCNLFLDCIKTNCQITADACGSLSVRSLCPSPIHIQPIHLVVVNQVMKLVLYSIHGQQYNMIAAEIGGIVSRCLPSVTFHNVSYLQ